VVCAHWRVGDVGVSLPDMARIVDHLKNAADAGQMIFVLTSGPELIDMNSVRLSCRPQGPNIRVDAIYDALICGVALGPGAVG